MKAAQVKGEMRYYNRLQAFLLLDLRLSLAEVAEFLRHTLRTLYTWLQLLITKGLKGLKPKSPKGRKAKLSKRQKQELKLARHFKRLSKYDCIILDDLGYVQQSQDEMEVLFSFFAERYERGSVMISSNLPFSAWDQIFKNPMVTAAAVDRLVHYSVILELNLPSYRAEQAQNKQVN